MSSNASTEKPTGTDERPSTTASQDDEWEFVNEKEHQPSDSPVKKENDLEKGTEESSKKEMSDEERKRELNKTKWEGMQQQSGGVYPHREVKVPSYPKFMGDW
ncbi:hypothetical protein FAUST_8419 [Fusarium austroamericanum]|uniref:Uncharacterized protein n=1 Tax=Fusarium austroamericanum TaxID=282268 RepID=A0AAN6BXX5_FUSAU|nr:hypothetical protein FAUST_8419 [Fusarium austroamericanum]